ncbi:hypothetical protein FB451DRAFT_1173109 [Mycena latifolia]|nr:hypothetical protein FB451DRAFT_1173109 [Mycena latifolia]
MSAENTPILAGSIPAFELFISSWKSMLADPDLQKENIAKFIQPGLDIAMNYYNKMGDTDAYIIDYTVINPSILFEWTRKDWSQEQDEAKKVILVKASQPQIFAPEPVPLVLVDLARILAPHHDRVPEPAHWQSLDFSGASGSATGGEQSIEDEMNHYMSSSLPLRKATDMTTWPRIFRLFADYAPIQATSVPSNRVFSSSAETDTKR